MRTRLFKNWWLLSLKAFFILLLGVLLLGLSDLSLKNTCLLTGLILVSAGIFVSLGAFSHRRFNFEWTWWLLEGTLDIIPGLLLILLPDISLASFVIIVGIWILINGLIQLITAINIQYYVDSNLIFIIVGLVALAIGTIFFIGWGSGHEEIIILLCIFSIFYGLGMFYISVILRKVFVEEIGEIEELY